MSLQKVDPFLIQNQNKKICADCRFFIEDKCKVFGEIDIINGEHKYEDALTVRKDHQKCGEDAIFYRKNHFKFITDPLNYFSENWLILCSQFLYGLGLIAWVKFMFSLKW